MLNKVILMGRLCAEPEFRQTTSGVPCCRIRLAVNRPFRNKETGEQQTDFINVIIWRNTAEFVSRYFHKGSMMIVEGSLRNDNYTDNNGVKHYSMEVLADNVSFGESKAAAQAGGVYAQQSGGYQQQGGYQQPQQGGYAQPAPPPAMNTAPQQGGGLSIGDIGQFEEILSDGEVPF